MGSTCLDMCASDNHVCKCNDESKCVIEFASLEMHHQLNKLTNKGDPLQQTYGCKLL